MSPLKDFVEQSKNNSRTIQQLFLKIKVQDYFEYLAEKTADERFFSKISSLIQFSSAEENYFFDLDNLILDDIPEIDELDKELCEEEDIYYDTIPSQLFSDIFEEQAEDDESYLYDEEGEPTDAAEELKECGYKVIDSSKDALKSVNENLNFDITVGELLTIACKMIYCDEPSLSVLTPPNQVEKKKELGRKIVFSLMIEPFDKLFYSEILADIVNIPF